MRKRVSLLLLLGLAGLCHANDTKLPKLIELSTHDLSPYGSFQNEQTFSLEAGAEFRGIAVDRVRCVLDRLKIEPVIKVVPWKRAQAMAKENQVDGFFAASQQTARDEYAVMSNTIAAQKWTWYVLKSTQLKPDHNQFKYNAMVSSFNGANMQKYLQNNGYKVGSNPDNTEQLFQMLIHKRLDAALANNLVMDKIIRETREKVDIERYVLRDKPLGVYFTKTFLNQYPDFLEQFNQTIPACLNELN